jgi:hypothetical protein
VCVESGNGAGDEQAVLAEVLDDLAAGRAVFSITKFARESIDLSIRAFA